MYDHKSQFEFSFPATHGETTIEVIEKDCLEAALHLKLNKGLNPAVLNMASAKRPGGGYKNGSGAQEGAASLPGLCSPSYKLHHVVAD
jgi:uncharacterized protein (TIGR02452 family)